MKSGFDKVSVKDILIALGAPGLVMLAAWLGGGLPSGQEWVAASLALAAGCIATTLLMVLGYVQLMRHHDHLVATLTRFDAFDQASSEKLRVLKLAVNHLLKVGEGDLVTASEIREFEGRLPAHSTVFVVNPDYTIEIDQGFIDIVRDNITRGVKYVYIVRRDDGPLASRLRTELGSYVKIREVPTSDESEIRHAFDVLCHLTLAVYHVPSESESPVYWVAPGFEPQCAVRLPARKSGLIVKSVEEYVRFLDQQEPPPGRLETSSQNANSVEGKRKRRGRRK